EGVPMRREKEAKQGHVIARSAKRDEAISTLRSCASETRLLRLRLRAPGFGDREPVRSSRSERRRVARKPLAHACAASRPAFPPAGALSGRGVFTRRTRAAAPYAPQPFCYSVSRELPAAPADAP